MVNIDIFNKWKYWNNELELAFFHSDKFPGLLEETLGQGFQHWAKKSWIQHLEQNYNINLSKSFYKMVKSSVVENRK